MVDKPLASTTIIPADHTTKQTLGALLGNQFNVKGFGAAGDNVADDTAEIQAAVDAAIAAGGGTVFFPIGQYKISSSINFNNDSVVGIRFLGEVAGSVTISGAVSTYLLDRHLATPNNTTAMRIIERLNFTNSNDAGGCIRIGSSVGAVIRDCTISGHIGVTTEDTVGVSSTNTTIQECHITGRGNYTDCNALIIGGGGAILGSDFRGLNTAIRAYGSGLFIGGSKCERNVTGLMLGVDSGGNDVGLNGFTICGHTFEGNSQAVDFVGTVSGFAIGGITILGHNNTPSQNNGPGAGTLVGMPAIEVTQYGIRIRANKAINGSIHGVTIGNVHKVSGLTIENSTARANIIVTGVSSAITQDTGTGVNFQLPTKAHTCLLLNNNTTTETIYTFANLPSSPLEGEEFSIGDALAANCSDGSCGWGANVTGGGGALPRLVRYNGTNWTVVGK